MKSTSKTWHYLRPLLFIIIGIFNTIMIRPEEIGGWKNYLGYVLLLIGIIDAFFVIRKYFQVHKNKK